MHSFCKDPKHFCINHAHHSHSVYSLYYIFSYKLCHPSKNVAQSQISHHTRTFKLFNLCWVYAWHMTCAIYINFIIALVIIIFLFLLKTAIWLIFQQVNLKSENNQRAEVHFCHRPFICSMLQSYLMTLSNNDAHCSFMKKSSDRKGMKNTSQFVVNVQERLTK